MQIAVINKSSRIPDDVLAFAAKACDAQVMECAAAWGIDPTPVAFYAREQGLPQSQVRIMAIVDEIDADGAAGYHDDALGVIYGRVLAQSNADTGVTLSHECLEELIDPTCDKWRDMGGGRQTALEVCDAVEADTYEVDVEIVEETRKVVVSNYLLPKWFDPAATGNFDRMGRLKEPFTLTDGGYILVRDRTGDVTSVFARRWNARLAQKQKNPDSRVRRRGLI